MPPSAEAGEFRDHMSGEDKRAFNDLLMRLQKWYEKGAGTAEISFHPESRACMWGLSLSKIADAYREAGNMERAAVYMTAAWKISSYPLFANNAAQLYLAVGDLTLAKELTEAFLDDYRSALDNQGFCTIIGDQVSPKELDALVANARERLSAIEQQSNRPPN